MRKNLLITICCLLAVSVFSQTKTGYFIVKKSKGIGKEINDSSLVVLNFYSPNKEPAKSHVKFTINNDTVFPVLTSEGSYSFHIIPGTYEFGFFGIGWHDIRSKSLQLTKYSLTNIKIYFEAKEMKMPQVTYDLGKPALYFYPLRRTEINVNLIFDGKISFSYPKYESGWKFFANPNGKLEFGENLYNYIFWEGVKEVESLRTNWDEGFIINSDSLVEFFERNLKTLKLNSQEIEDFITFWVPKMKLHSKNFIHFLFDKEYDQLVSLKIEPNPDNLIRFFMVWAPLQNNLNLTPQKFPVYKRNGFTVVDWGGTEIKKFPTLPQ